MLATKIIRILLFLLFLLFLTTSPAFAFKRNLRCQIIRDAITFAPEHLQGYLVNNFEAVHKGVHHVDMYDNKMNALDPFDAQTINLAMIDSISKGKLCSYNTAHRFGVLAGYVAETVSPVEHKKLRDLIPGRVEYDGQHPVTNIKSSLSRIIRNYRNPYLGQQQRKVTDFLYIVAVNEIVDHWTSVWTTAKQDVGELKVVGYDIQRKRQADLLRGVNLRLPG